MSLPYSSATSGKQAMNDLQSILQNFGAQSFGFFEDYEEGTLTVQFKYRDQRVSVVASSKGYAVALMRQRKRKDRPALWKEADAIAQGQIAVFSILRDWIKGQITAVECGILSFQGAFLGQIVLPNGETVLQRVEREDILSLPSS
jgi:hypothetical protein